MNSQEKLNELMVGKTIERVIFWETGITIYFTFGR